MIHVVNVTDMYMLFEIVKNSITNNCDKCYDIFVIKKLCFCFVMINVTIDCDNIILGHTIYTKFIVCIVIIP